MAAGFVYVMFMSEMPHCLKIGKTTREPGIRAKELYGTSAPLPFRVLMQWRVSDVTAAESAAHRTLDEKRVASNREFFHVTGPEAIEKVGEAIRPYLLMQLDPSLLKKISDACDQIANKYLRRDIRTNPPTPMDTTTFQDLSQELHSMAVNSATNLLNESNDPRTILAAIDIVDLFFEGPIHINNSPQSLLSMFCQGVGLLTFMMNPDAYLMVGANYVAPSVFNIIANISRTASNVMEQENLVINSDAS